MSEDRRGPGPVRFAARLGLSSIFLASGAETAMEPGGRVAKLEAFGIPEPELAIRLNGACMVLAGTALALGIRPRLAAIALLGLLIPTTVVGHPFWREQGAARSAQRVQFLKNVGLAGGLLAEIASDR